MLILKIYYSMYKIHFPDRKNSADFYVKIIEKSIVKNGDGVEYIDDLSQIKPGDNVVTLSYKEMIQSLKYKPQKSIVWIQGIMPEERELISGKKGISAFFRYRLVHSLMEKYAINHADLCLFVSESMKNHFEKKYKYNKDNYLIMPCFNTSIEDSAFYNEKYKEPSFLYSGSTLGWQCFPEIVALFKSIKENILPNAKLYIYSNDTEVVNRELEKNKVTAELGFVPYQELNDKIKKVKYGFLIRKDIAINNVATPTKMSSYLANGIIPVFSDVIGDFKKQFKNLRFSVPLGPNYEGLEKLTELESLSIDAQSVKSEYETVFSSYYNEEKYIDIISKRLKLI